MGREAYHPTADGLVCSPERLARGNYQRLVTGGACLRYPRARARGIAVPILTPASMTPDELAEYRRDLEAALRLDTLPPLYASRDELRARLEAVLAEQARR